jgi:anti-anti-sigma factor
VFVFSAPFRVGVQERGGLVYLHVSGDLDRSSVGQLRSALEEPRDERVRRLVFDLSRVTFLDAGALAAILDADRRGHRDGFDVVIVRPPAPVGRIFTLTRAAEHLSVVDHPLVSDGAAGSEG